MLESVMLSSAVVQLAANAASSWLKKAEVATEEQRDYQEKLEHAPADDVFRYVFLINNSAVEKYVSQSRAQAEASFLLSRRASIAGFALLLGSIVIGLVSQLNDHPLDIAYLAAVAGATTQFLSGVFFWLYNRTLQQIHLFYQGIMSQQTEALAAIGRVSEAAREAEKGHLLAGRIIAAAEAPEAEREPPGR
jgi:Cyanobacterial TRADD-N associated 2-Transmembrane domain